MSGWQLRFIKSAIWSSPVQQTATLPFTTCWLEVDFQLEAWSIILAVASWQLYLLNYWQKKQTKSWFKRIIYSVSLSEKVWHGDNVGPGSLSAKYRGTSKMVVAVVLVMTQKVTAVQIYLKKKINRPCVSACMENLLFKCTYWHLKWVPDTWISMVLPMIIVVLGGFSLLRHCW